MNPKVEQVDKYWGKYNCAQSTAAAIFEKYNFLVEKEIVLKLFMAFGGGLKEQLVCGAVTGSIAALSYILKIRGNSDEIILEACLKFRNAFKAKFKDLNCGNMLKSFKDESGVINWSANGRNELCTDAVHFSAEKIVELLTK